MTRFANILETVGNTPVVRINKLAPAGIDLYVKIEAFNPLGSVKDRLALGVIEDAERTGELKPGQTVIEATSGNTGIGLAMVCAAKGYPLVVTMAESFSIERRRLMRFLGAKVVLTPARRGATGMVRQDRRARRREWLVPDATVRERGERRLSLAHHGAGDRRRFQGPAARLLGHRLRNGRHAQGRGTRARQGAAGNEDRRLRAGRCADGGQRAPQERNADGIASVTPPGVEAAPDPGMEPGLHPQARPGRGRRMNVDRA